MATPISVLRAAERFVVASSKVDPSSQARIAATQTTHVIQLIGGLTIDQVQAAEFAEALAVDGGPFSAEQRQSMHKALIGIIAGEASAVSDTRHVAREQSHMFLYNYFPQPLWDVIMSTDSTTSIMRHIGHFAVEHLGLRNANGPTKRLVVAIIHSAQDKDANPTQCYDDLREFANIMRQKRDQIRGEQQLVNYPEDHADFMRRFPTVFVAGAEPVACPIDIGDILARSRKDVIPQRATNALVANRSHSASLGLRTPAPQQQQLPDNNNVLGLISQCMNFMMGGGEAPRFADDIHGLRRLQVFPDRAAHSRGAATRIMDADSPPVEDRIVPRGSSPGFSQSELSQQSSTGSALVPGCLRVTPSTVALSGNLAELQQKIRDDIERTSRARSALADEPDQEEDAAVDDTPPKTAGVVLKKPAAATSKTTTSSAKSKKKAATHTSPPPSKAMKSSPTKTPTLADIIQSTESIFKYPELVDKLSKAPVVAGRPSPSRSATAYCGGKIYFQSSKSFLRVYARSTDKVEQRMPIDWSKPASAKKTWALACAYIESDPRRSKP